MTVNRTQSLTYHDEPHQKHEGLNPFPHDRRSLASRIAVTCARQRRPDAWRVTANRKSTVAILRYHSSFDFFRFVHLGSIGQESEDG